MTKRDEIVAEARSWKGTPFHHLARVKGVGVDCVGLVYMVARDMGFEAQDMEWYPRHPINGMFEKAIDDQTVVVAKGDEQRGDLLKFKYFDNQQHIGIITEVTPVISVVHAFAHPRTMRVIEANVEPARVAGARRFRELA